MMVKAQRLALVAALLWSTQAAAQPRRPPPSRDAGPPAPPVNVKTGPGSGPSGKRPPIPVKPVPEGMRQGFMLKIADHQGLLTKPAKVTLRGSSGTVRKVSPADNGVRPDVSAGDRIYTAPVPSFPDLIANYEIRSGDNKWTGKFGLDPKDVKATMVVKLARGGKSDPLTEEQARRLIKPMRVVAKPSAGHRSPRGERPKAPAGGAATYPDRQASEGFSRQAKVGPGFVLWALLFVSFGLGLAITVALLGRRSGAAAQLVPPAAPSPVAPMRLQGPVDAALAGPLASYRVVLLGPAPEGADGLVTCQDEAPLPDELVAAVESLAVTQGAPVALLLTDKELLDQPDQADPVVTLNKRVAGRFPLWVVDGPEDWELWTDQPAPTAVDAAPDPERADA